MSPTEVVVLVLLAAGVFFFAAGTVALVRFPDLHSRLHALTKADNVGLGLVVLASGVAAPDPVRVFKLGLIWLLVLVASASVCFLLADEARRRNEREGMR